MLNPGICHKDHRTDIRERKRSERITIFIVLDENLRHEALIVGESAADNEGVGRLADDNRRAVPIGKLNRHKGKRNANDK